MFSRLVGMWSAPNQVSVLNLCLTLNMQNCFKDYEIFVHILSRILDLASPK